MRSIRNLFIGVIMLMGIPTYAQSDIDAINHTLNSLGDIKIQLYSSHETYSFESGKWFSISNLVIVKK